MPELRTEQMDRSISEDVCYESCKKCGYVGVDVSCFDIVDGDGDIRPIFLCRSCRIEEYRFCHNCMNLLSREYYSSHGFACPDCIRTCEECLDEGDSNYIYEVEVDGEYRVLCEYCRDQLYWCDNCEQYYEGSSCRNCGSDDIIHSWDYKPNTYNFRGTGPLFFGVELEMELKTGGHIGDIAETLLDMSQDRYFFKHDGSLDNGFELVTSPTTFEVFKEEKEFWDNIIAKSQKMGMRGYKSGNCGMHIHMSKKAFTNLQLFKFLCFFEYRPKFTKKLSQRSDDSFSSWSKLIGTKKLSKIAKCKYYERRNCAVNLSSAHGLKTIELRLFRSSLDKFAFWRKIEFAHALYNFCKIVPITNIKSTDLTAFQKYLIKNENKYPNILKWLNEKKGVVWNVGSK